MCDRIVWLRDGRVESQVKTTKGVLVPGEAWPGKPLPVLELQDRLASMGVDVVPRELTVRGVLERFAGR